VSAELPTGELILLVGSSGAGKSTLLRCVNGLTPHFTGGALSGSIQVNGLDPVQAAPQVMSRHVGFVFQDPESQFVLDRVEDEIAFALENSAMPRPEMRVRVEEALDLLDLAPLRERPLATLSGGEKQRVAIAAALALRPQILVLDEPTSQLDPKSAEDVLNALVRLNNDLGLTILLAEHRLERVASFAGRVLYLSPEGGELLCDAPAAVFSQIDLGPPLVQVGKRLGWSPLPLTIKEGLRFARGHAPFLHGAGQRARGKSSPQDAPFISIQNVEFSYKEASVLNGVSLAVHPGEVVALMGRNGSGKSTLLRNIVGLLRPTRGRIAVAGQDIRSQDVAAICRRVAYLPQDPNALLFADTVRQEMEITLRNHGEAVDAPPMRQRMDELLRRLRLSGKATAYPRDLSVGERQRVALAAVAITRPDGLLLDEPTRGLDGEAKAELITLLAGWRAEGMAILLVTHDVELAAQIADRVAIMSQGEIIAEGPPEQVMAASPLFAPQIARLFPGSGWLTAEDVINNRLKITSG
jgi:energy-coupling factor transport system ATP-binding protein